MKLHLLRLALLTSLILGAGAQAAPAVPKKAWITMGDGAYQQLRKIAPRSVSVESRRIRTPRTAETVHVVALAETDMAAISGVIHQKLRRCGGFLFHATEGEARAALRHKRVATPRRSYAIDNREAVTVLLPLMQAEHIAQTIVALSGFANRYYNSQSGVDASGWLMQKWAGMTAGRSDIAVTQFAHASFRQPSVILTIKGSDNAEEAVVVGAHLDSILSFGMGETALAPGADDDASGIASMTEALRVLVEQEYKPRRTIHLIAYAAEEAGLRGSQEIAKAFKQKNRKVAGVLQLDMTNYKGAANDIYLFTDYTDNQQNAFMAQLLAAYLPELKVGYDKCGYGCSDHASWDAQGYPVSMPFESSFARANPYIHSSRDTFANSGNQAAHALKFARLAVAFLVELGSDAP